MSVETVLAERLRRLRRHMHEAMQTRALSEAESAEERALVDSLVEIAAIRQRADRAEAFVETANRERDEALQRAEAAERERDQLRALCVESGHEMRRRLGGAEEIGLAAIDRAHKAESDLAAYRASNDRLTSDLAAERDLKRIAYAKLDEVRKVVEETIISAMQAVEHPVTPEGGDMGFCARCGASEIRDHRPSCDLGRALAAARKALED